VPTTHLVFPPPASHGHTLTSRTVFLSKLEYFQGICFLTTNRIASLDHAFQSRVDLFLPYRDLTPAARRRVWEGFVERAGGASRFDIAPGDVERLADVCLNGREIRNLVKSAHLLALQSGDRISGARLEELAKGRVRALDALAVAGGKD
jgi:hypothetical protein